MEPWKRFTLLIIAVSSSVLLAAFVSPIKNEEPSAKPLTIAVSQTPLSAPFIALEHLRLDEKYNLNLRFLACTGGVVCSQKMFTGEADFATASESVVMFKSFERDDFVVLTSFVESANDLKLLTLESRGVERISDLQNKRVGIIKASASEFYFDSMLIANSLKGLDLERVYLKPTELNEKLVKGDVDAISVWEPYGYMLQADANEDIINLSLPGIYHLSFNLLSLNTTYQQNHEQTVRLLQALAESVDWINTNQEKARTLIAKKLNVPEEQLLWSWKDYVFRLSLSNALLSNLQMQARWAVDANLTQEKIPEFRSLMAIEALEEAIKLEVAVK